MQRIDAGLVTPIYLKTDANSPWPSEKVFYLLSRDGLFLCRNHEFFRSCVPAPRGPSELEDHNAGLELKYPRIPMDLFEQAVGFFHRAWKKLGGESCVLLAYNRAEKKVEIIVPEQVATVSRGFYGESAIGLSYQMPKNLPPDVTIFCDIHSHCDMGAYASGTDADDETHRTGLHIVVGRLHQEPPQFHAEAVADGKRFRVNTDVLLAEYRRRNTDFPVEWMDKISAEYYGMKKSAWANDRNNSDSLWTSDNSRGYSNQSYVGYGYQGGSRDRDYDDRDYKGSGKQSLSKSKEPLPNPPGDGEGAGRGDGGPRDGDGAETNSAGGEPKDNIP
jgi:hypothetical protein